jgi:ribosome recycling factor
MATVKECRRECENSKVAIRNVRSETNNGIKKAEKDKEISEDERDAYLKDAQDLTDKFIKELDAALEIKVNDIMSI